MKYRLVLALGLSAVAFALLQQQLLPASASRRVTTSSAHAAGAFQAADPSSVTSQSSRVSPPPQTIRTGETKQALAVREIGLAELKEMLRRDAAKGARPLLVNFWATWCEPCRDEFPDLVEIDTEYRERGLEFVIISLDDPAEIKTSVPEFLRKMRARMPAYLLSVDDPDVAIKAVDAEWTGALPATFLFDAGGRIVYKRLGRIKSKELRESIDKTIVK